MYLIKAEDLETAVKTKSKINLTETTPIHTGEKVAEILRQSKIFNKFLDDLMVPKSDKLLRFDII